MHTILLVGKALVVFLPNLLELCEVFDLEVRSQSDNIVCQFLFYLLVFDIRAKTWPISSLFITWPISSLFISVFCLPLLV